MKIDSHQHFWSTARGNDYGFLTPEAGVLYQDYQPDQLAELLKSQGIQSSIVVQAAETVEETMYLLELVENVEFVAGVVGWIDLDTDATTFQTTWNKLKK